MAFAGCGWIMGSCDHNNDNDDDDDHNNIGVTLHMWGCGVVWGCGNRVVSIFF